MLKHIIMISYAPNFEDVLISRCFVDPGYYAEIGAVNPITDSVNHWAYGQGWRGVNMVPETAIEAWRAIRPADDNRIIGDALANLAVLHVLRLGSFEPDASAYLAWRPALLIQPHAMPAPAGYVHLYFDAISDFYGRADQAAALASCFTVPVSRLDQFTQPDRKALALGAMMIDYAEKLIPITTQRDALLNRIREIEAEAAALRPRAHALDQLSLHLQWPGGPRALAPLLPVARMVRRLTRVAR
jgi:hypothetical protein